MHGCDVTECTIPPRGWPASAQQHARTYARTPRPERPTKRRSSNTAKFSTNSEVGFFSSAASLSSLPADRITLVPRGSCVSEASVKGAGRYLLQRQWQGRTLHTKLGLSVQTNLLGLNGWATLALLFLSSPSRRARGTSPAVEPLCALAELAIIATYSALK